MSKKIGIYGWSTGELSFGVTKTYLQLISRFGTPVMLSPAQTFEPVDLLLLPGGLDLNPSSYGAVPEFDTSGTDVFKQHVYDNCLPKYVENNIPIMGICLGLQQLASYFGSKLTQDMPWHKQSSDRWKEAHKVEATIAAEEMGLCKRNYKFDVNSHHHQAVLIENLGEDLVPLAIAENELYSGKVHNKNIVESFVHATLPIAATQWHPEEWYDAFSLRLIDNLLSGKLSK